jgi:gas vesicle protein
MIEEEVIMGKSNNKDFIMGSLVGGFIGAAAALFLAPKSGKEIRDDLGQQANVVKKRTGRITSDALEKSSGLANAAKDKTVSLSQAVTEQSSQIMNKVRDMTGTTKGQSDFIEKEIEVAMEQISDDVSTTSNKEQIDHSASSSELVVEKVESTDHDIKKDQPQVEAKDSSEDQVKTQS